MLPFTKDYRLRKPSDFRAVRESGHSWPNRLVVIWANSNARETTRIGVSVGKRIGNAVVRNLESKIYSEWPIKKFIERLNDHEITLKTHLPNFYGINFLNSLPPNRI